MKQIYFIIFLFFTSITFAQNDLLGEWFIHYINIDGNQQYSTIPGSINTLNFENTSFYGSICNNGHSGQYTFNTNNTITITDFAALGGDCSVEFETLEFLNPYQFNFLSYFDTNPVYSYSIYGVGANEILTLTSANNNFVVYGRSQLGGNEVLAQWYLQYIVKDDVVHPNYYNEDRNMDLIFIETDQSPDNYQFTATSSCNDLFGTFSAGIDFPYSPSSITFNDYDISLLDCDVSTPKAVYVNLFLDVFTNNNSGSTTFFAYELTTVADDTNINNTNPSPPPPPKLTLTNDSGDSLVYYLTLPAGVLVKNWYLSRIEIPGNPTIEIPSTESPSLTITNDINPNTFRTTAFGEGECNAFMSDYEITLNNGNSIQLLDFSPSLGFCMSDYEDEYFSIIGFPINNFSEFEIINNGTTLNITDLLGARLVFGDEPLSISDHEINTVNISLKNNPVATEINLEISQSLNELQYQIYSIEGKLIKKAQLNSESINVESLNSGLYFIRFTNEYNQLQTIKFIKQ